MKKLILTIAVCLFITLPASAGELFQGLGKSLNTTYGVVPLTEDINTNLGIFIYDPNSNSVTVTEADVYDINFKVDTTIFGEKKHHAFWVFVEVANDGSENWERKANFYFISKGIAMGFHTQHSHLGEIALALNANQRVRLFVQSTLGNNASYFFRDSHLKIEQK